MRMTCKPYLRLLVLIIAWTAAALSYADEADPNAWMQVKLDDGTEITAKWVGDEHFHFLVDTNGNTYMPNAKGTFSLIDEATLEQKREAFILQRLSEAESHMSLRKLSSKERDYYPDKSSFLGKKKGLVILVEFGDGDGNGGTDASTAWKFSPDITGDTKAHFNKFLNQENLSEGKYIGSVHDYFYDQSYGKFDLTFDVVGPVTLSKNSAYYAGTTRNEKSGEMAKEAFILADELVDYSDYDWNGDGCVNQVAIVYAGGGESSSNSIWAHKYTLTESKVMPIQLDGMTLDVYCMVSELTSSGNKKVPRAIGTFIHEYSHCFGFPDLYDVVHWSGYGVGFFDVMGSGEKNGSGYCPAGYSAYEKMCLGWLDPVVLSESCKIRDIQPLSKNGETYLFYTDNPDSTEYYIIENRQKDRWDAGLPAFGLLVYRVDFSETAWRYNVVNCSRYPKYNQHERFRVINADNNPLVYYYNGGYYVGYDLQTGVPFPQPGHDAFSDSTYPQMVQYNGTDKKYFLYGREMTDITQNDDGTISFDFHLPDQDAMVMRGLYLDEMTEEPATYLASESQLEKYNVHTNMSLKTNRWLTMWLPFQLDDNEVKAAFGNDTRVALFTGGDDHSLRFSVTQDGIPANTPVLIYIQSDNELEQVATMTRRFVPKASSPLTEAVNTKVGPFTFVGVSNYTTVPKDCYFFSNGALYKSTGTTTVKAFKGYFKTEGNGLSAIDVNVDEGGQQTYVDDNLVSIREQSLGDIYTLSGNIARKDAMTTEGLPKGVYVLNGKKIIIK
ncbi:MAG: M6 family metalloprotease domain-containing protein [Prevotella sp.]|nr:M6 family metalloprotease domain-containing protein [Prevotella sp.]